MDKLRVKDKDRKELPEITGVNLKVVRRNRAFNEDTLGVCVWRMVDDTVAKRALKATD